MLGSRSNSFQSSTERNYIFGLNNQLKGVRNNSVKQKQKALTQTILQKSSETRLLQMNKKIHTMSRQSYIIARKKHLLKRKLNYIQTGNQEIQIKKRFHERYHTQIPCEAIGVLVPDSKEEHLKQSVGIESLKGTDVFKVEDEVMRSPFDFHRKMIFQVHDNKGVRKILDRWYEEKVQHNIEQLHRDQVNKDLENNKGKKSQRSTAYGKLKFKTSHRCFTVPHSTNKGLKKASLIKTNKSLCVMQSDYRSSQQNNKTSGNMSVEKHSQNPEDQGPGLSSEPQRYSQQQEVNRIKQNISEMSKKLNRKESFGFENHNTNALAQGEQQGFKDCELKVNQNSGSNRGRETQRTNCDDKNLMKLMVKLQPYWYKIRLKV